jgi:ATP-binding cassette subfamily C protein EexD
VTLFIISHRTSVLKSMDKLLVMKEGQVSMFGPRDQVLAQFAKKPQRQVSQSTNSRLAAVRGGRPEGPVGSGNPEEQK